MLSYSFQLAERIGGRAEQQDAAGALVTRYGLLVLVCDGMGGARGGSTASRMAVDLILRGVQQSVEPNGATALLNAIREANRELFLRSQHDASLRGMGTTVTALLLQETHATLAHAGDSRIYQLRKDKVVFRTTDHSKVFELVKRGILNEEQARLSEDANVILRALGIKSDVEVELHDPQPYLPGDRFLLCTDGVSGAVPEELFLGWLASDNPVDSLAAQLVDRVDEYGFRQGGDHDNLTAALVECGTPAGSTIRKSVASRWPELIRIVPGLLLALALAYIAYERLVAAPRQATERRTLVAETKKLKQLRDALTTERDSLRRLLNDPAVRQAVRRKKAETPTGKPELSPPPKGLKTPSTLAPADSGTKSRRGTRPGTLLSPAPIPTDPEL
ncbi:MAG: serine/threonine-protein phosphatase [Sphingobacteriaceae bacterium]|nr:serine/threonine-protein phosphatase [Cytophagaceae bacterium]